MQVDAFVEMRSVSDKEAVIANKLSVLCSSELRVLQTPREHLHSLRDALGRRQIRILV